MGTSYNPRAVTDGLMVYLDAASSKSYPGSGATWIDLSGQKNNSTAFNNPVFSTNTFVFSGTNDYIFVGSGGNTFAWAPDGTIGTSAMTIEVWVKPMELVGCIVSRPWNGQGQYNYIVGGGSFAISAGTTGGGSDSITYTPALVTGSWQQLVCWMSTSSFGFYVNGGQSSFSKSHTIVGAVPSAGNMLSGPVLMTLYPYGTGPWSYPSFGISGSLAVSKFYNRVLSADEVYQNYVALKGRFGL